MSYEKKEVKTEADVAAVLKKRYSAPEWAFLTRVRNQTGFNLQVRTADAVAMNLYPSRGFEINGFEIKVSKSDVIHELEQPEKSAEIQRFCHRWWLVINDKKIIDGLHLPMTWGVIETGSGKCRVLVKAPTLRPEPLSVEMVASLLRNATESFLDPQAVEERVNRAVAIAKSRMDDGYRDYERLKKNVDDFQKASGVQIHDRWDAERGGKIGAAVEFVLSGRDAMLRSAEYARSNASAVVAACDQLIKSVKKPSKDA